MARRRRRGWRGEDGEAGLVHTTSRMSFSAWVDVAWRENWQMRMTTQFLMQKPFLFFLFFYFLLTRKFHEESKTAWLVREDDLAAGLTMTFSISTKKI
jgi:hypothetical protein